MTNYIALYDPRNGYAKVCYDEYFQFVNASKHLGDISGRLYALRYEPSMGLCAVVLLASLCGIGQEPLWLAPTMALIAAAYAGAAIASGEAVVRRYNKQHQKRAILRVHKFLYEAARVEAVRLGLTDWAEWPTQRFQLFSALLLEESALLGELDNDCGCEESCKHTNRLPNNVRAEVRANLRAKTLAKLSIVAESHRGALDANMLRVENVQGMLEQERGPNLPPAKTIDEEE